MDVVRAISPIPDSVHHAVVIWRIPGQRTWATEAPLVSGKSAK